MSTRVAWGRRGGVYKWRGSQLGWLQVTKGVRKEKGCGLYETASVVTRFGYSQHQKPEFNNHGYV